MRLRVIIDCELCEGEFRPRTQDRPGRVFLRGERGRKAAEGFAFTAIDITRALLNAGWQPSSDSWYCPVCWQEIQEDERERQAKMDALGITDQDIAEGRVEAPLWW